MYLFLFLYAPCCKTLADRRKLRQITLMYKIVNGEAPSYLMDLLPNIIDFFLFDLILYVSSTIFQLCRDGSSSDKQVLS